MTAARSWRCDAEHGWPTVSTAMGTGPSAPVGQEESLAMPSAAFEVSHLARAEMPQLIGAHPAKRCFAVESNIDFLA